MTRKSKFLAGAATILALVSISGATLSRAQVAGQVASKQLATAPVKIDTPLPPANTRQRHLVRVVDVSNTTCGPATSGVDPSAIENERLALLARRARLEAEIQGRDKIFIPEQLRGRETEAVQRPFREEAAALQFRVAQFAEQIEAVQQSMELMKREGEVIEAKDVMMQRQVSLLHDQLDVVDGLLKRGSATVSQKLALEQTLAQYESSHLDLQLSGLKSRQDLIKTQQSIGELRNQLRTQDLVELGQTQARISDLSKDNAAVSKPPVAVCDQVPGPVFEIVPGADGAMQVMPISPIGNMKPDFAKSSKAS